MKAEMTVVSMVEMKAVSMAASMVERMAAE
jgi:hypothetical protein